MHLELRAQREAERAALVQQRRHRHHPALALLAEQVRGRHLDVGEEDLVELGLAGDLPQRPHLDPGRVHVHGHVREALVARRVRVAEADEDAPVGDVRERRPDLLAVEDEHVAAPLHPRAHRCEVGAGIRLGEALAPDLLGGQDLRQVRLLLLLGAVRHDRRPGHAESDHADVRRRARQRRLLEVDRLEAVRRAGAAVLLRPRQAGVARVVERAAPVAVERVVEPLRAAAPAAPLLREIRVEPGAQLRAEGGFLGSVAEVHVPEPSPPRGFGRDLRSRFRRTARASGRPRRAAAGSPPRRRPRRRPRGRTRTGGRSAPRRRRAPSP